MYKNVMSYTDECCALKMPTDYVTMDEDEMMYVDGGGWTTYKNGSALAYLSNIAGQAFACAVGANKLGKFILASSATGWGLVVAAAAALGVGVCIASGTVQAINFALAMVYYRKYKKFDAYSISIWNWSATAAVRKSK